MAVTLQNMWSAPLMDETLHQLTDFLFKHATDATVEIEGKLGIIWNKNQNTRWLVPGVKALLPLAVDFDHHTQFRAEITADIFQSMNEKVMKSRFEFLRAVRDPKVPKMTYTHSTSIDRFYEVKDGQTVRVSESPDGKQLACIVKNRLGNIDFSNSVSRCDFRISASTEVEVPRPSGHANYMRKKDRMSYRFEIWSIDLSKVSTTLLDSAGKPQKRLEKEVEPAVTYEVEMEIIDKDFVLHEREKCLQKKPNNFTSIAKSLLDNLRTLARFTDQKMVPSNWAHPTPASGPPRVHSSSAAASGSGHHPSHTQAKSHHIPPPAHRHAHPPTAASGTAAATTPTSASPVSVTSPSPDHPPKRFRTDDDADHSDARKRPRPNGGSASPAAAAAGSDPFAVSPSPKSAASPAGATDELETAGGSP